LKRFAVIAVAVLVLAGGGYWLFKQAQDKAQAAELCTVVKDNISKNGEIREASTGTRKVAILGDSYTAGDGLADKSRNWVHDLGAAEKWSVKFDGVGMTGYVNGGYCGDQPFSGRATALAHEAKPDLLIVQGGLNDVGFSSTQVEAAAYNVLSSIPAGIDVVAVGPVDAPARDGEQAVDAALSAAAKAAGKRYVSALDWRLEFLPDATHLTEAGHAEYARRVAEAIR